jgi:hypothetical protein
VPARPPYLPLHNHHRPIWARPSHPLRNDSPGRPTRRRGRLAWRRQARADPSGALVDPDGTAPSPMPSPLLDLCVATRTKVVVLPGRAQRWCSPERVERELARAVSFRASLVEGASEQRSPELCAHMPVATAVAWTGSSALLTASLGSTLHGTRALPGEQGQQHRRIAMARRRQRARERTELGDWKGRERAVGNTVLWLWDVCCGQKAI